MSEINIIYGPPGSGKTTVAESLPRDISYLSVGRLARKEFENETALGYRMRDLVNRLEEYSKDIIKELMEPPISSAKGKILLDGFPKYTREVDVLESMMNSGNIKPGTLFNIEIDSLTAWHRVIGRKVCSICDYQSSELNSCPNCDKVLLKREDDNYEDFMIRYNDYKINNGPVKSRLIELGFTAIQLTDNTAEAYRDIIVENLLNICPSSSEERAPRTSLGGR